MNPRQMRILMNLCIIIGPVLVIMFVLTFGLINERVLTRWDLAISIGAMVTVLIFLFNKKT